MVFRDSGETPAMFEVEAMSMFEIVALEDT
jgi:hypothetical protein